MPSKNIFGISLFSDVVPLNHVFQSATSKQISQPSTFSVHHPIHKVFGSQLPSENFFKTASSSSRIFSDATSTSSGIFFNFNQIIPTSNNFDKTNLNFQAKNINEGNELKELELEKQKIEMKIRKEEEAERLRKQEKERLQREEERKKKDMEEKLEKERKEKERIEKEKAKALKRLQQIELISEQTVDELINEFLQHELEVIANNSMDCYHQIKNASEDIYYELLAEMILEESADWERSNQEKIDKIENTPIWIQADH